MEQLDLSDHQDLTDNPVQEDPLAVWVILVYQGLAEAQDLQDRTEDPDHQGQQGPADPQELVEGLDCQDPLDP